jgi:hypothetical protein
MRSVSFVYGSGNFSGTEYTDNVRTVFLLKIALAHLEEM